MDLMQAWFNDQKYHQKLPVKPHLVILSPALANANNGNWQTARRWARMLRTRYRVTLLPTYDEAALPGKPDLVIALHARRSAEALSALLRRHPQLPSIVVLTGTDLYRDIRHDPSAQQSLRSATRLVVLQEAGLQEIAPSLRAKAHVIYQSAPVLKPIDPQRKLRKPIFSVCMIGHLRAEKDPAVFMRAAQLLTQTKLRFIHIGGALDPALARQAEQTQQTCPHYHWLGNLPHAATRQYLKKSHLMVIASTMEGGANVIIEAVNSGVPVIASDIAGNRGMLGDDYAGYFPQGDSAALAGLIERAAEEQAFYMRLHAQCQARAPLFVPEREKAALLQLVDNTLH